VCRAAHPVVPGAGDGVPASLGLGGSTCSIGTSAAIRGVVPEATAALGPPPEFSPGRCP
jgi:hypothetical protein